MSLSTGGSTKQVSSLSKAQKKLASQLGPLLQQALSTGSTPIAEGDLFSAEELEALKSVQETFRSNQEAVAGLDLTDILKSQLSGDPTSLIDEKATETFFKKSIAAPLQKDFLKNILPQINRQYKGFTTRRADAISRAWGDLSDTLASEYANLRYKDEQSRRTLLEAAADRQTNALGMAETVLNLPNRLAASYGQMATSFQARRLSELQRMLPENNPAIQQSLAFLGIPMTVSQTSPAGLTGFGDFLASTQAIGNVASSFAGTASTLSSINNSKANLASQATGTHVA